MNYQEKRVLFRFIRLCCYLIFHILDDIIVPGYKSQLPNLKVYKYMLDECNEIRSRIRSLFYELKEEDL